MIIFPCNEVHLTGIWCSNIKKTGKTRHKTVKQVRKASPLQSARKDLNVTAHSFAFKTRAVPVAFLDGELCATQRTNGDGLFSCQRLSGNNSFYPLRGSLRGQLPRRTRWFEYTTSEPFRQNKRSLQWVITALPNRATSQTRKAGFGQPHRMITTAINKTAYSFAMGNGPSLPRYACKTYSVFIQYFEQKDVQSSWKT